MKAEILIKIKILHSAFLACVVLLGCKSQEQLPIPSARVAKKSYKSKTLPAKIVQPEVKDVIWVNGTAIPMEEINRRLENFVKSRQDRTPLSKQQTLEHKKRIEDLFIARALLHQHALKKKLHLSEKVLHETLADMVDKNFGTREAFLQHLKFKSISQEEYLAQIKTDILAKKLFHDLKVDKEETLDRFFQDFQEDGVKMRAKVTLFQTPLKRAFPPMSYRKFRTLGVAVTATHGLGWVSEREQGIPTSVFSSPANAVVSVTNEDGTFFYWVMKKRQVLNPHFLMVKHRLRAALLREKREAAKAELIIKLRKEAIIRYGIPGTGLTKGEDERKKKPEIANEKD